MAQQPKVGDRVTYTFPGDKPRPGVLTDTMVPGGMWTAVLDDGIRITNKPDFFDPEK